MVGIELLSEGKPIVGADIQGIKDYVIDGKTGFLCNPYDSKEFSKAILKLSDSVVRMNMKENCVEMAKLYNIDISIQQREKIYDNILE